MAKNGESGREPLPPYVSFKTLEGVIKKFKETTVPDVVDTSVLRTYANSVARQIIAAMKYLDLIEDGGKKTDRLVKLRNAYGAPEWQPALAEMIYDAYRPIIGGLNLDAATPTQLAANFRRHGAEGAVLQKCMAFFVAAAKAAGISISPYIANKPRARAERNRGRSKKAQSDTQETEYVTTALVPVTSGSTVRFAFPIPGKSAVTMFLPADLTLEDWEMVDTMMKAYVERRKKTET